MELGKAAGITSTRRRPRIRACRPQEASPPVARPYDRARDLPRLIPLWAETLVTGAAIEDARLLEHLRRALRAERTRGKSGHWSYDLARHAALLRAYRAEAAALQGHNDCPPQPTAIKPIS